MKVLLRNTIEKLGERGEIVNVADGYARNYLLPRRLAVPATPENFKQLEIEKQRLEKLAVQERAELDTLRERMASSSCTIVAAASPEGHLYGSVGARDISEALTRDGIGVAEHAVRIEEPIKEIGVYVVDLHLGHDLVAQTRVWVVAEEA